MKSGNIRPRRYHGNQHGPRWLAARISNYFYSRSLSRHTSPFWKEFRHSSPVCWKKSAFSLEGWWLPLWQLRGGKSAMLHNLSLYQFSYLTYCNLFEPSALVYSLVTIDFFLNYKYNYFLIKIFNSNKWYYLTCIRDFTHPLIFIYPHAVVTLAGLHPSLLIFFCSIYMNYCNVLIINFIFCYLILLLDVS